MYDLTLLTEPTLEPVTLSEAKRHLAIANDEHDTHLLNALIPAARKAAEVRTHRQLITASWTMTLEGFPASGDPVYFPLGTFQSVDAIRWWDKDLSLTTMTVGSDVLRFGSDDYANMVPISTASWDTTAQKVEVDFTCGYGATRGTVPELLRQGILLVVAHLFEWRENVTDMPANEVPGTADTIFEHFNLGDQFTTYAA